MEYKFTKDVEADFDKIASGKQSYEKMLSHFWESSLKKDLEEA
jgi:DNA topoisomerase IA